MAANQVGPLQLNKQDNVDHTGLATSSRLNIQQIEQGKQRRSQGTMSQMKEDVNARAPKINQIKNSPKVSPRKLLNSALSRQQQALLSIGDHKILEGQETDKVIYQNFMNNYQNSIEEVSELDESKRNSVSPYILDKKQSKNENCEGSIHSLKMYKSLNSQHKLYPMNDYLDSIQLSEQKLVKSPKEVAFTNSINGSSSIVAQSLQNVQYRNTAVSATTRDTVMSSPITKIVNKMTPKCNKAQSLEQKFWQAAEDSNIQELQNLVKQGVSVNCQNLRDDGWTALHYAAHEGLDQVVEFLIRKLNADVNALTINGRTALHIACAQQHKAVIERLLLAGAKANIQSKLDGNTPLHLLSRLCTSSQNQDLINLLLPFSQESLSIKNKNGFTPAELSPLAKVKNLLLKKQEQFQESQPGQTQQDNISTVKNSKVQNFKAINGYGQQNFKTIEVCQFQSHQVNVIFNHLNVQMKNQKPCIQPKGELDSDDVLFESTSSVNLINQNNSSRANMSPMKNQNIFTTNQTDEYNVISFDPFSPENFVNKQRNNQKNAFAIKQTASKNTIGQKIQKNHDAKSKFNQTNSLNQDELSHQNYLNSEFSISNQFNSRKVQENQQGYSPLYQETADNQQDQLQFKEEILTSQSQAQLHKSQSRVNLNLQRIQGNYSQNFQEKSEDCITKEKQIGPEQFVAHQLLGTGSFGEVYLVEKSSNKKLYAMKVLSKSKIKQQNLIKYALSERNIMSVMHHPFIVRLRYAFQTQDKLFLICDYCPGGDLSQYLEIEKAFSEEKAKFYIVEILLALESLHERDIIFRDLKPDNIVLDETGHALLTDFGLSKEGVPSLHGGAKSFCGSYAYLAPEMIKKAGHGKAVDWYLLGVVFYEMLTGMPPYYADDKEVLFQNIMNNELEVPDHISTSCQDLLRKLLNKNPVKRLGSKHGAEELKAHEYFRDVDWQLVYDRQLQPPEPYLAEYAKSIIQVSPYMAAGHPQTRGKYCQRDHPQYVQGWSFAESNSKRNSGQDRNAWYISSVVGQQREGSLLQGRQDTYSLQNKIHIHNEGPMF